METLLQTVGRLYGAASAPGLWPAALEAIAGLVGAGHISMFAHDGEGVPLMAGARLAEQDFARMATPEAMHLGEKYLRVIPDGIVTARAAFESDRDWERGAFYNEIIRPANGFHSITALRRVPEGSFILTICRPRRADAFATADAAKLQALVPHLITALEFHGRLRAAENRSESVTRLFDRLTAGVILVDAHGRPVFANTRAQAIAASADGLTLDAAGIAAATPDETRSLRDAVAALSDWGAVGARRLRLRRPSLRPPLLLSLLPMWRLDVAIAGVRQPRVAIFMSEPDLPAELDRAAVADAFQLSSRESEIAMLLAGGLSPAAIAAELGIGVTAVRQYLKRAFDKTGARTQAALVALVRGFVSLND